MFFLQAADSPSQSLHIQAASHNLPNLHFFGLSRTRAVGRNIQATHEEIFLLRSRVNVRSDLVVETWCPTERDIKSPLLLFLSRRKKKQNKWGELDGEFQNVGFSSLLHSWPVEVNL